MTVQKASFANLVLPRAPLLESAAKSAHSEMPAALDLGNSLQRAAPEF